MTRESEIKDNDMEKYLLTRINAPERYPGDDPLDQSQSNLISLSLSRLSRNHGEVSSHQKKRGLYQGNKSGGKKL